jgi:hypothetical protein
MTVEDVKTEEKPDVKLETPEEIVEPLLEPQAEESEEEAPRVHPLAPGGKRFEQIYAQSKQTQRDLDVERERRIAAEAKLDLLSQTSATTTSNTQPEYSWPQLEQFIAEGKITRADAQAHREEIIARKLKNDLKTEFTRETTVATRTNALANAVGEYVNAVPDIAVVGTPARARIDAEFEWLAQVQGVDPADMPKEKRHALQLTALRTVYGPIESLVKRAASPRVDRAEGLPGGTPPRQSTNPDQKLLDSLTKAQVTHYKRMMESGRYKGGWKEVVEELKYVPKRK